jgi:drug/metabolite transporter (DMT)-like permease
MDTANRPVAGIIWMLLTGACFVAVTALVKYLGDGVPAAQAAFLRYLLGLVFLIPMIGAMRRATYTRSLLTWFGVRGVAHTLGVILWFYAMTRIPIAEVTAMNYLNPVYVTIGAALFMGEKLAGRRIFAIAIALLGAVVILRPGFRELNDGHFAMLFTAVFFAVSYLLAKKFSGEVSATVVVAMLSITVTIGLAPFAWAVWVTPTPWELLILFGVACFATAGHFTMTLAFAAAPLTVTQPVTFLQLVWATLLGFVVFGEGIDGFVVLGGGLIIASVSFITWREAQLRRGVVTPSVLETKV